MKDREDIEKEFEYANQKPSAQIVRDRLVLKVLLDIRDIALQIQSFK